MSPVRAPPSLRAGLKYSGTGWPFLPSHPASFPVCCTWPDSRSQATMPSGQSTYLGKSGPRLLAIPAIAPRLLILTSEPAERSRSHRAKVDPLVLVGGNLGFTRDLSAAPGATSLLPPELSGRHQDQQANRLGHAARHSSTVPTGEAQKAWERPVKADRQTPENDGKPTSARAPACPHHHP